MYIGLKRIQQQFTKNKTLLINSDSIHCLTGWTQLKCAPTPYSKHVLYTCDSSEQLDLTAIEKEIHLLCVAPKGTDLNALAKTFPEGQSVLFVESDSQDEVHSTLQAYFDVECGVGLYGQTLLEFLSFKDGLQAAIEYSYQVFQNPVFVFDDNFNLIAATWEAIKELNIEDTVILNKRFSSEAFVMANRLNNIHAKIQKSEIPIRAFNEMLGYEQMYCEINTMKRMGHIVVSAVNKPFEPIDSELLLLLKKYVNEQMKKDLFIQTYRGFTYERFLWDLLDNKIAVNPADKSRLQYIRSEFYGNMFCLVVETTLSAATINVMHIRNIMENRFPGCKAIVYNGEIVAVLSVRKNQFLPDEYIDEAKRICGEHGLYAGLSNSFQDIMNLADYFKQALRAIEIGAENERAPGLFQYRDYAMDHVRSIFCQKEKSEVFCHPQMRVLLDYDKEHNTELAYTLYMYLLHERNLSAAAEAMAMHRTSLVYRFKKIDSLLNNTFDDPKDRLYLIFSYELNCS